LIHGPKLLILDEPTVGLDPVLREKIWEFLIESTRSKLLSIIITTHYIEEAVQADRCGLMRNGVLMAEDEPRKIMQINKCETLEDAFLKLCMNKQRSGDRTFESAGVEMDQLDSVDINENFNKDEEIKFIYKRRQKFHPKTIKALLTKSYLQIMRHPL
jgi:ABC-type multidrug transport system ATPase subunit